jgi:hypothetical protein
MKRILGFGFLVLAVAGAAFFACSKQATTPNPPATQKVTVTVCDLFPDQPGSAARMANQYCPATHAMEYVKGQEPPQVCTIHTKSIPDCEKFHTGTLQLENRSLRSLDYIVVIDGINYGRLKYGETKSYTLSVGKHSLGIPYADHAGVACILSYPTISECQTLRFYCTG